MSDDKILSHLKDQAIRSYDNTSFSPEKRGETMIDEYSEELVVDMEELKAGGADEANIADYRQRYERYFTSYLHAKSNTFSVMITGGSNFPVRRHEKANRSERRHYEIFREWRVRAKKAIIRKAQPEKTFTSELERYRSELAGMKHNHELMKACNSIIKKSTAKKQTTEDCIKQLVEAGLGEEDARKILVNKFGYIGYPSFRLTNNNASMKRIEEMIKTLEQKEEMAGTNPITKYSFDGGEMVINYEIDRIQVFFSERPTTSELNEWKSKGLNSFNWSPSNKAWQRKITANALHAVKRMLTNIVKID